MMTRVFEILSLYLAFLLHGSLVSSIQLDWSIDWVIAAPDGYPRPVVGVNGQWPPPTVQVDRGELVTVHVENNLGNETTSIHWHGMTMYGTSSSDGAGGISQCVIPPNASFTHHFTADPVGASWYHAHEGGSYPDGLRGSLIVRDSSDWFLHNVTEEFVLTISDWYHDQMPDLVHGFLESPDPLHSLPLPNSILINDGASSTYNVEPNKTYLFRIINMAAASSLTLEFLEHKITVVRADGSLIQPEDTSKIYLASGQRYEVLLTTKSSNSSSYEYILSAAAFDLQTRGRLQYGDSFIMNESSPTDEAALDEYSLYPADGAWIWEPVAQEINLTVGLKEYDVGWRSYIGEQPYVTPKVPTLFSALTTDGHAFNASIYGGVAPYVVDSGNVVQVIINNPLREHPMHLHGHQFQYVYRSNTQPFDGNEENFKSQPMRRDTVIVPGGTAVVLRFIADNPGVWSFHCHNEWHVDSGMVVTIIEAPDLIQQNLGVPSNQKTVCKIQGIKTEGNCAGELDNILDTSNCNWNVQPAGYGYVDPELLDLTVACVSNFGQSSLSR
jgi:iron transport multicopper oxidase